MRLPILCPNAILNGEAPGRALSGCADEWEYAGFDLFGGEGLADVALRACGDGAENEWLAAFGGNHDDGDALRKVFFAALLEELEAVHDGHVDVAEDEGEWRGAAAFVAECGERFFAVGGLQDLGDFEPGLKQCALDHLSHDC